MTGMVGREYTWRGRTWRVLARWRTPAALNRTGTCPGCGFIITPTGDWACRCVPMPDARFYASPPRNVLLEDIQTGERIVRPFRGLRRLPVCEPAYPKQAREQT